MPLRSDWSGHSCPIARSLNVVGDPWTLLVLRQAMLGVRRFDDFRAQLDIADNVLTRRLRGLVEAGLLRKERYRGEQRSHHEYLLTEAGADLLPVLNSLALWGQKHTPAPSPDAGMLIIHRTCGQVSESPDTCSSCGLQLVPENVSWDRGRDSDPTALTGAV